MSDDIRVEIDVERAAKAVESWGVSTREGARKAVHELAIDAEASMKEEAPRGAGIPDTPLQTTVAKTPDRPADKIEIMPHKRTQEGWLLAKAIIGSPSTPTYGEQPPPVWVDSTGDPQGRLATWAAAKLGDKGAAFAVAKEIQQEGHDSFPNPFVYRSAQSWIDDVADVTNEEVADALKRASP